MILKNKFQKAAKKLLTALDGCGIIPKSRKDNHLIGHDLMLLSVGYSVLVSHDNVAPLKDQFS
jgi:hypothetical protein